MDKNEDLSIPNPSISIRKIVFVIILNFTITITEIIGGLFAGSLALLSDALHNFSDGIAILISYWALLLSQRKSTLKMTFGFKRAEILAALFNSSVLIIILFYLFKEAYQRFFNPSSINGFLMMIIALIGLFANGLSVFLLKPESRKNLNIKSAYIHLIVDTLSSVGVFVGSIFILLFKFYYLDSILTLVIGVYILRESYLIIKETINILMQTAPEDIDLMEIKNAVEGIPEVENLHHVHIWQLNDKSIHFEGHIDVCADYSMSKIADINHKIERILQERFGINHTTIQFEFGTCKDKEIIKTC